MSEVLVEDDGAAFVTYFPAGAWEFRTAGFYSASSYHLTSTPGAYVTLTFNGSFVAYYSDMNHDHGAFTVSIDGRAVFASSSYAPSVAEKLVLFSTALAPGRHLLTVTNAGKGTITGVDYFVYNSSALHAAENGTVTVPEATPRATS